MKTFISHQARGWAVMLSRISTERGQTMAEYGILIAVIAIVVVAAAVVLGGSIGGLFRSSGSYL